MKGRFCFNTAGVIKRGVTELCSKIDCINTVDDHIITPTRNERGVLKWLQTVLIRKPVLIWGVTSTQSHLPVQCFPMQMARNIHDNGGGLDHNIPAINGVEGSLRNINQFSIAPAIGGCRRINRWQGHHRSVLETVFMADERSQQH